MKIINKITKNILLTAITSTSFFTAPLWASENSGCKKRGYDSNALLNQEKEVEAPLLKALDELKKTLANHKLPLEEVAEKSEAIFKLCPPIISKNLEKKLNDFDEFLYGIYQEEFLQEPHLIFDNPANYWIFFKTEKRFFDIPSFCFKRKMNYVISSASAIEDLLYLATEGEIPICNAIVALLDNEKNEIYRIEAGLLLDGVPVIGSFEISEKDYKKIRSFSFVVGSARKIHLGSAH